MDFLVLGEPEDRLKGSLAQVEGEPRGLIRLAVHHGGNFLGVLNNHSELRVSRAHHASIIDVGTADESYSIIHDDKLVRLSYLAVDVN